MKENRKVGRPKLADSKLKKESLIVSLIVITLIVIVGLIGFQILTIDNPKDLSGTVYNSHVNSCILENDVINCGPNVVYLKYKVDNNDYVEIEKKKNNIRKIISSYNKVTMCYKTNNSELICTK